MSSNPVQARMFCFQVSCQLLKALLRRGPQISPMFHLALLGEKGLKHVRLGQLMKVCTNYLSGIPGKHHYYLNVDRCAYGGGLKLSAPVKGIANNKQICGPLVFAVNHDCSAVYYYQHKPYAGWKQYQSVRLNPYLHSLLKCEPKEKFT